MKILAGLLLSAAFLAAPAWADEPQANGAIAAEIETSTAPIKWYENFVQKIGEDKDKKSYLVAPTTETDQFALSWNNNGRWGLTLDMTRRSGDHVSILPEEEISAGAYYQFSPRFRIGGGISIGGEKLSQNTSRWDDQENETGVRIESAFSF